MSGPPESTERLCRILFVCTANHCRSPFAQGLAEHRLARLPWGSAVEVDSAATHPFRIGQAPDAMTQTVALRYGVDLSARRARLVQPEDFGRYDLVIGMQQHHLSDMRAFCPAPYRGRLRLLMQFAPGLGTEEIPDPFGGLEEDFLRAFQLIERGVDGLIAGLAPLLGAGSQGRG